MFVVILHPRHELRSGADRRGERSSASVSHAGTKPMLRRAADTSKPDAANTPATSSMSYSSGSCSSSACARCQSTWSGLPAWTPMTA